MADTPPSRQQLFPRIGEVLAKPAVARLAWILAVAAVLLVGGVLRFQKLGWDQPAGAPAPLQMQPDERFLSLVADRIDWPDSPGQYFDTAKSPLNPYNTPETPSFVYGTFPLFLAKGVGDIAGPVCPTTGPEAAPARCERRGFFRALDPVVPGFVQDRLIGLVGKGCVGNKGGYDRTVVCGRHITAMFDIATILVVFGLGAALFGRRAGLLAALLYALSVLPTQLSHFWAVDPYLTFFATLAVFLAVLWVRAERDWQGWALGAGMGLALGLAVASKVNGLLFVPVVPAAALIRIGVRDFPRLGLHVSGRQRTSGHWMTDVSVVCFAVAIGILVFRVAQPYAFAGPRLWDMSLNPQWRTDVFEGEWKRQKGEIDFPPFVQFAGRSPLLYPLRNLVLFGLGPALGIAAWLATAAGGVLLFKRRDLAFFLPVALTAGIFGIQGIRFVTYMRYFAPIYPLLCLMAGWACAGLWRTARRGDLRWSAPGWLGRRLEWAGRVWSPGSARLAAGVGVAVVVLGTAWWALAFQQVYRSEQPRIAASRWIYANVPPGSTITSELWDDSLPYAIPGQTAAYKIVETAPYDTDSLQKMQDLVYGRAGKDPTVGLNGADYVAISSNRVRSSVPRLEREYPATIRYYELLDSGELGFDLVADFKVQPSFLGLSVDDSSAEESFTVYDHPEVRIYKKSARWDPVQALALLNAAHPERAVNLLPKQGRTNGLQETAAAAATQQGGGTFADVFDVGSASWRVPWVWWLLWLEVAAFASLPWLTWLLRGLPDRGYGLSKLAGLVVVALGTWLLVAWNAVHFSGGVVWAVYGTAVGVGAAVGYIRRRALIADLRERWPSWLAMEVVFLAAFAFFLALRYANPDLWYSPQGGEKPVELAYLTAVAKSSILPPYDPWFAGGTMNYYYMGWFFLAVPMRALKIVPEVGFNLGVPTFAALAAVTAMSTVHNLVAASGSLRRLREGEPRPRSYLRPAIIAGVFGAVLLIFIGNLDGAHQAIQRFQGVNQWTLASGTPFVGGAVGAVGGIWQWLFHGAGLAPFDWWRSSRVHIGQFDITEFPYWSALFADLHPQLMGLPFFGVAIALSVAYVLSAAAGLRAQTWALAAGLGAGLGLVRTVHTWDFPTATLLTVAAVGCGQLLAQGRWQRRWWDGVAHVALVAGVLTVAFAPYAAHTEVFQSGLTRSPEPTKPEQYFAHFGVFLAFTVAFIAVRYFEEMRARGGKPGRNPIAAIVAGPFEVVALAIFVTGLTAFTWRSDVGFYDAAALKQANLRETFTVVALSAVLLVFLFNLVWWELRARERDVPRLLATAMLAAAIGIAAGVDLVVVKNDIVRMNTVFKFSLQAWQLYALGSAYAGWYCARALWAADGWRFVSRPGRGVFAWATAATAGVLLFGASIYLYSGTEARQEARFAKTPNTLNGLAYLKQAVYYEDKGTPDPADDQPIRLGEDEPLIRWLRANVRGSPVIAEAIGPLYHWTGRISWNTGLPAVIGWDWHEIAYRMDYAGLIQQRRSDTTRFYSDANTDYALTYLRQYNVRYVVVGTEERIYATPAALAKFAAMPQLREVFRSGENVIYEVTANP
ncbi:MAG: phospholipid carrier-dependent glycosyltransferase [Chloroflexi bacterium]|nr:phospholipid carrier-dependent glycosyltransferase [Chloroflexota bacterium]